MRRFLIAILTLGGFLVAGNARAADPADMIPGRTLVWTDRAGVEHDCVIVRKNDQRLRDFNINVDPGIFVCELVEAPGNFIYITAGKSRVPA